MQFFSEITYACSLTAGHLGNLFSFRVAQPSSWCFCPIIQLDVHLISINKDVSCSEVFFRSPARVAQWWACRTNDLVVCEFDTWLRRTFFSAYFRLSPLLKQKSSLWLWKENCVSTGVRKPGNARASPTAMV